MKKAQLTENKDEFPKKIHVMEHGIEMVYERTDLAYTLNDRFYVEYKISEIPKYVRSEN